MGFTGAQIALGRDAYCVYLESNELHRCLKTGISNVIQRPATSSSDCSQFPSPLGSWIQARAGAEAARVPPTDPLPLSGGGRRLRASSCVIPDWAGW